MRVNRHTATTSMAQGFPVDSQPQHSVCLLRIERARNAYGMGIVAFGGSGSQHGGRPPRDSTHHPVFSCQIELVRNAVDALVVPEQGALLPISC
jgi:hypothetical protein